MTLTLSGKTLKGKNKIRELGNQWNVLEINDRVLCLDYQPGFLIHPATEFDWKFARWIRQTDDPDFILISQA